MSTNAILRMFVLRMLNVLILLAVMNVHAKRDLWEMVAFVQVQFLTIFILKNVIAYLTKN